jgi:hypothetical protein
MILDIQKKVFSSHLRRMITFLAFAVIVLVIILVGKLPYTYLGFNKYQWAIVVCGVYILLVIYEGFKKLNYIYFSDEKNVITLRYFSLGYFSSKKNAIEIPKNEFLTYEIRTYFAGGKTNLILHRSVKNKDAKYPPVSLSLLNKKEIQQLTSVLDLYKKI